MKVLVVDDDPVLRAVVSAGLKALKHDVTAVDGGVKAWEQLRQGHFPVMITDWAMPDMNGIQLTQALRAAPRDSYTYVIMLTGKGTREDYLTGVRAGVDSFLIKPLDGAMLEAQLTIASRIVGLQEHARRLESIMTVCSYCKRVREEQGWVDMEQYIKREFKTLPSHTFCPTCFHDKVEPEMRQMGLSTEGLEVK
ncbi:MAG TPA: response regulator [Gemmatimonadaceae bacterium]|nr:response regulator [Gemmatimonadaceae bacterium]